MFTKYSPMIGEHDYEQFRRLMPRELPETYEEWVYLEARQFSETGRAGPAAEHVDLKPEEFIDFCREGDWPTNLTSLATLAWHIGCARTHA